MGRVGGVGALPLADAWEDGAEEPASVGATESEVPPPLPPPLFAASLRIVCYALKWVSVEPCSFTCLWPLFTPPPPSSLQLHQSPVPLHQL